MKQAITKVVSILTQKMLSTVVITLLTVVAITAVQAYISTSAPPVNNEHVTNKAYVDAAIGAVSGAGGGGSIIGISFTAFQTGNTKCTSLGLSCICATHIRADNGSYNNVPICHYDCQTPAVSMGGDGTIAIGFCR